MIVGIVFWLHAELQGDEVRNPCIGVRQSFSCASCLELRGLEIVDIVSLQISFLVICATPNRQEYLLC